MLTSRTFLHLAAGCALVLPLASCGGSVSAPRACSVLTPDTAKQILGPTAKLTYDKQPNFMMTQCQYRSANGDVTIMVGSWAGIQNEKSTDDKPVSGIGDEASVGFTGVTARKGVNGINVSMILTSGDFWGKAADDDDARTSKAEEKVAAELVTRI